VLERVADHYELIILDCPPGFSLLAVNAIVAAHALLLPVSADPLALDALNTLLGSIERVRTRLGAQARVLGLVVNGCDGQRKQSRERLEQLRAEFRDRVFHTELPYAAALNDAPARRQTIFEMAPKSPAADAFRRLAGEVLQRLTTLRPQRPPLN
jgi:chromosome partitioning protein